MEESIVYRQLVEVDANSNPKVNVYNSKLEITLPKLDTLKLPKNKVFTLGTDDQGHIKVIESPENLGLQGAQGAQGGSLAYFDFPIGTNKFIEYTGEPMELSINNLLLYAPEYRREQYPGGFRLIFWEGQNAGQPIRIILSVHLPNVAQGMLLQVINMSGAAIHLVVATGVQALTPNREAVLEEDDYTPSQFYTTLRTTAIKKGAIVSAQNVGSTWIINGQAEAFLHKTPRLYLSGGVPHQTITWSEPKTSSYIVKQSDNGKWLPCKLNSFIITLPTLNNGTQIVIDNQSPGSITIRVDNDNQLIGEGVISGAFIINEQYKTVIVIYNEIEKYWRIKEW